MKKLLIGEKRSVMLAFAAVLFGAVALHALLERLPSLRAAAGALASAASPVLCGFALAFVMNIPMRFLEEKVFRGLFPKKPGAARAFALITVLLMIPAAAALVLALLIPGAVKSVSALMSIAESGLQEASRLIESAAAALPEGVGASEWASKLPESMMRGVGEAVSKIPEILPQLTFGAAGLLYKAVVTPVICIHSLVNRDAIIGFLKRFSTALLPKKRVSGFLSGCSMANVTFRKYFTAQLTGALIVGALCYIGSKVLSQPYPELISLLTGIGALIPVAGPWLGIGLSALMIYASGSGSAITFVIMMLVIQLAEDNLIYPHLIGSAIGMRGVEVLAVVVISGGIAGFVGLLLGVPTAAVARKLIKRAVDRRNMLRAEAGETA